MSCLHQQQQQALQGLAGSYQLGTTLGEGAFGKVLLAVSSAEPCLGWQPTAPPSLGGRQVVVKQVRQHCTHQQDGHWELLLTEPGALLQVRISGLSQQEQLEAINEVKVMQVCQPTAAADVPQH
jgi:serine/threonine protein kinase